MTALREAAFSARLPDQVETGYAKQIQDFIVALTRDNETACLSLANGNGGTETVTLTPAQTKELLDVLEMISNGKGCQMILSDAYFTTEEAAYLLNVRHSSLLKLLDKDKLPSFKIGPSRCIPAQELFAYRKRKKDRQRRALEKIAKFDQENNLL